MNRTNVCWKCRLTSPAHRNPPHPRLRKGLSSGQSRHGARYLSTTSRVSRFEDFQRPVTDETPRQLLATPVEDPPYAEGTPSRFSPARFSQSDSPLLRQEIQEKLRDWQNAVIKEQKQERIRKEKEIVPISLSLVSQLASKTRAQRDLAEDQEDDKGQYSVLRGMDDAQLQSQFFDESVASFEDEPLKPGDLVDYGGKCVPAIYLRSSDKNTKFPTAQLFSRTGEIVEVREDFIHFCAPASSLCRS